MKNIKGKYLKPNGETGRFNSNFCSIIDDVKIDDIVVVRSNYGLGFAVVTMIEDTPADLERPKALCIVPNEEEIIF